MNEQHYFKDQSGGVHVLSDEDIGNGGMDLLPVGVIEISSEEASAILNPPPTVEQLVAAAIAKRDVLLAEAALVIAPLQDAVDLEEATAEEKARLTAWKQYRVALNRIQQQPDYPTSITWPLQPGSA